MAVENDVSTNSAYFQFIELSIIWRADLIRTVNWYGKMIGVDSEKNFFEKINRFLIFLESSSGQTLLTSKKLDSDYHELKRN